MPTSVAIKSSFFNVIKTDAVGLSVRNALGDVANSVVEREDLNKASLPTFPFMALQWVAEDETRTGLCRYFPIWWVYDSPLYRQRRIGPIVLLIKAAYPEDAITGCHLDFMPRRGVIDESLGHIPGMSFPFQIRTRG